MEIQKINYEDEKVIQTLINTVAKGASKEEFAMFTEICKATGLNPFKKEIWFIKTSAGVQMMVGLNGFYCIANNNPNFDGIETEVIENDKGQIVKAIARVYRKDRRIPMVAEAYMSEFGKTHGVWKSMPRIMLTKCAESLALRKAFPQELNGLYTQEEMPAEFAEPKNITPPAKPIAKPEPKKRLEPNFDGFYRYQFPVDMDDTQRAWINENVMIKDHKVIDAEIGVFEFPEALIPQLNKFYMESTNE